MKRLIATEAVSARYRSRIVDVVGRRLLVTNFIGTEQEKDLTLPPNCNGFGRIRHFRRGSGSGWPSNPLPIEPACRKLGLPGATVFRAQAFQLAACNWRCWYCFVPFDLLAANPGHSAWLTPAQLLDLYLAEDDPPPMLDLTGGQPDLVPEWVPWMMDELCSRGLEDKVYLWSDDSLSTDYFWRYLDDRQREAIARYRNYGRVCCFKGFDPISFSFNTRAEPHLFEFQFDLLRRLLNSGIDLYLYATFTTPDAVDIQEKMRHFVDRLQELDANLPLRLVPLEIKAFTPVIPRLTSETIIGIEHQYSAIACWMQELERRFDGTQRSQSIVDVQLRRG